MCLAVQADVLSLKGFFLELRALPKDCEEYAAGKIELGQMWGLIAEQVDELEQHFAPSTSKPVESVQSDSADDEQEPAAEHAEEPAASIIDEDEEGSEEE